MRQMINMNSRRQSPVDLLSANTKMQRTANDAAFCPTVLIVDDDEAVRDALHFLIMSFGWRCRSFASAFEFLTAYQPGMGDCLLLDLNMPGMNGAELQEELRRQDFSLPVVIITGEKGSPLFARSVNGGAASFLIKPFQDEALKSSVERALQGNQ